MRRRGAGGRRTRSRVCDVRDGRWILRFRRRREPSGLRAYTSIFWHRCRGLPGGKNTSEQCSDPSFASPKESTQRKGDPRFVALRVPCVTRNDRPLRNSGSYKQYTNGLLRCSPSNSPRGHLLSFQRYSAPLMGAPGESRQPKTKTSVFPAQAGIQVRSHQTWLRSSISKT